MPLFLHELILPNGSGYNSQGIVTFPQEAPTPGVETPTTVSNADLRVSGSSVNRGDWNIQSDSHIMDLLLSLKLTETEATATRATTVALTNIQEVATPVTQAPAESPANTAEASWCVFCVYSVCTYYKLQVS
jgi:hypothetical protein